jgi:hypothetical protein
MTPPPWRISHSACKQYIHLRHWADNRLDDAEDALEEMMPRTHYVNRDRYGREYWRSPSKRDNGLRWIIDPRGGGTPKLVWVGQSAIPARVFAP